MRCAVVVVGAAAIATSGCGTDEKLTAEEAAEAFAQQTSNPVRTNVACRPAGDRGPGWDYECWYTYLVDGEPVRTNTFVDVDATSVTRHDPS